MTLPDFRLISKVIHLQYFDKCQREREIEEREWFNFPLSFSSNMRLTCNEQLKLLTKWKKSTPCSRVIRCEWGREAFCVQCCSRTRVWISFDRRWYWSDSEYAIIVDWPNSRPLILTRTISNNFQNIFGSRLNSLSSLHFKSLTRDTHARNKKLQEKKGIQVKSKETTMQETKSLRTKTEEYKWNQK